MSIATEIERIKSAKESIINTLKANDVEISETATIDELDVTMKEVPILDTTDATATAADILLNKTAYVNGEKITGTMESSGGDTTSLKISNANYLFYGGARMDQIQELLSLCENVTTMEYCFNSTLLTEMDVSNLDLDVSNVKSMRYAFALNKNLVTLDLSSWNAKIVENLEGLFANSPNIKNLDISGIDASNVNTIASFLLNNTQLTNFKCCKNLGKGYVTPTANLYAYKLDLSKATLLTHDSLIDVINNLYDLNLTYDVANGGTLYTQSLVLGSTNKAKLSSSELAIATAKGWIIS